MKNAKRHFPKLTFFHYPKITAYTPLSGED